MEKLSVSKRNAIVGDYISALSYSEIAAKRHVSTGTVANVVADLKAGGFPEAADVGEKIEQLKELSLSLKHANLSPGKCAVGLMVLARINECGLDPADIDRWPLILKSIKSGDEAHEFVKLVYSIEEVRKKTGLSIEALHDKVHDLEKKAAELQPVSGKLADCKKQIAELTGQRKELASEVTSLEEKYKMLNPLVEDVEKREKGLSHRVIEMEAKAHKAEATLATLSKDTQKLQNIGLTFEELSEFNQKVQVVAHRHSIKPAELRSRLLHELATLDKGLGLEVLVKAKKLELNEAEHAVADAKKELETIKAVVGSLKQQEANLEASIKATRQKVSKEIAGIIPVARDTVAQLAEELRSGVNKMLTEVSQLREQSLETGKEVGKYQEVLEANAWLKGLLTLTRREEGIDAKQVKAIALLVAWGLSGWLKAQDNYSYSFLSLSIANNNLVKDLEEWKI